MYIILSCICLQVTIRIFTDNFQYAAVAVWNKLSVHIREAQSSSAFKLAYMKWFLTGLDYQGF